MLRFLSLTLMCAGALCGGAASAQGPAAPAYAVSNRIPGGDGGWDLLDVDAARGRLYVARTDGVMAVDLKSGAVAANLVPLQRGHGVLPIPGSDRVIASSGAQNAAILFEGLSGKVVAVIPTGKKPDAIAYDPATSTVWVMNAGSGDITVIDPISAKVLATVAVGGSLELGAADGAGRLYVNVEDKNDVAVIDTRTRTLLRRFPLAGCDGPTGVAYAADVRQILSVCANGVAVVSAPDGTKVASLKIGARPDGAAYDEMRHLAFAPSGADGILSIIRLGTAPQVVGSVATAPGARTIALDPSTGSLYLPSAKYGPAQAGQRPAMIPGSFAVLVVTPKAPAQ